MDDIRQALDKLREELTNAGKRLAELAEKAESELPAAGKRINEEYQVAGTSRLRRRKTPQQVKLDEVRSRLVPGPVRREYLDIPHGRRVQ